MREEDVLQVLGGSFFNSVLVDIEKNTYTRMNFAPWLLKISQTGMYTGLADFIMDFSLLSPLEFFVVPKNVDGRNKKPPAMRVRVDCYTKNHLSVYNRVVQAVLQKGKVIYGEERKFTCAYEMDVQISYRLHT